MPLYIYNSLTREKEEFIPVKPTEVKMYVCGPTVYDAPHIGHARSAYVFDVIRRYLKYRGYAVTFARNVTDVDDKIIEKARQEFPGEDLNAAAAKTAQKYLDVYHQAMRQLGILAPDAEPKATEFVCQDNQAMQGFIAELIQRGAAYPSGGDVYFNIKKAGDYGKLSHQALDKMEAGARIAPGEKKKDPLDFALWKAAKAGEPSWDSPWGKGRPGWHVECSVMSSSLLGDEFDIHGGGLDLIFPHHENEIAQSEGAGMKFARYWLHHGLLTINGQKMSKSLGNFVTVGDFINKYQDADLLKLFFLSAHYAHPIDYTGQKITEAKQALERIAILFDKVTRSQGHKVTGRNFSEIETLKERFIAAMDDDFNTPQALACIFELVNIANKRIEDGDFTASAKDTLLELASLFGLSLGKDAQPEKLSVEIAALIQARNAARKNGNFQEADALRKQLESAGIILEDTKGGATTWRRKL